MRNLTRAAMILATAMLAGGVGAGCGGDDDSSSGDLSTGLAESKLLSDVTAAEAQTACENLSEGFEAELSQDRLVRAFCTLFGAMLADTPADCETQRDQCIEQAADGQGVGAQASGEISGPDCAEAESISACQGTVGELETCANDMIEQISNLLDSFSCADAATIDENGADGLGDFAEPASCVALECADGGPFGDDEE